MKPQIDHVYVYKPSKKLMEGYFAKLDQRHITGQEIKFKRGNILEKSDLVYRYAKTIKIENTQRTIIMLTLDADKARVSKAFSHFKKDIEADNKLMETFRKSENKPLELGLWHVY